MSGERDYDALLAENERLREALRDLIGFAKAWFPIREGTDAAIERAEAALAAVREEDG